MGPSHFIVNTVTSARSELVNTMCTEYSGILLHKVSTDQLCEYTLHWPCWREDTFWEKQSVYPILAACLSHQACSWVARVQGALLAFCASVAWWCQRKLWAAVSACVEWCSKAPGWLVGLLAAQGCPGLSVLSWAGSTFRAKGLDFFPLVVFGCAELKS